MSKTDKYKKILTKEYLTENYSKLGKSPAVIAKEIECSKKLVYTYIDNHQIPRNKFSTKFGLKPNQKFNLLTTVKTVGSTQNGTLIWQCTCECGGIKSVCSSRLKNGEVKSCGCLSPRKGHKSWRGHGGISASRMSSLRHNAKNRNLEFKVTAKYLHTLYEKQNKQCAISGLEINMCGKRSGTASLDRIDNTKGYIKGNVQWVHKDINKLKTDFKQDDFIKYCKIIAEYNGRFKT